MPGQLNSMKVTKSEAKKEFESVSVDTPEYPYGLRIDLNNESLEKLGIADLPKVGEKMTVLAKVEVRSSSQSSYKEGEDRKNVSLQITDMSVGPEVKEPNAGAALYGDSK